MKIWPKGLCFSSTMSCTNKCGESYQNWCEAAWYEDLKDKQMEAMCSFLNGNNVFVSLPTGFGKTIIYATLTFAFDSFRGRLI